MRRPLSLLVGLLALASPSAAGAMSYMPDQGYMDSPPAENSMSGGTWADLPNGPAVRPYVKSLSVVNGATVTPVFSGGPTAAQNVQDGDLTATISPINLCRAGETPSRGRCYSSPNRIGVVFGYKTRNGIATDLAGSEVAPRQVVTADTVIDVVIGLNTLGSTLRWTWINGGLADWKSTDLGGDAGELRIRITPAVTPDIDWQRESGGGCTATPIFDCNIQQAAGAYLGANMVLSIDDTLDKDLTGAAFATQGAIAGFLIPGGSSDSPVLDLQMASAHLAADGSLQHGTLQAFLPAAALTSLYGVLPADAPSFFTAVRRGDPGTQNAPVFTHRAASDTSDEGLFVSVTGITFSAPTYRVSARSRAARVRTAVRGAKTTVTTNAIGACRKRACTVTVYRATGTAPTKVGSSRTDRSGAAKVSIAATKLGRGAQFLVAIRRGGKLVSAGHGKI